MSTGTSYMYSYIWTGRDAGHAQLDIQLLTFDLVIISYYYLPVIGLGLYISSRTLLGTVPFLVKNSTICGKLL